MKWTIISIFALTCLSPRLGQAEPVSVSFEWVELDCTKCPDLVKRFQSKEGSVVIVESSDPKIIDLEKNAYKRVLVHHVERIEPGHNTEHTTRINDTTFNISVGVNKAEHGIYEVAVNASLRRGAELDASVKPGTQLTAAQMKGVSVNSMSTAVELSHGQSFLSCGLPSRSPPSERHNLLKDLANIVGVKKNASLKLQVLIVGLTEPNTVSLRSRTDAEAK